MRAWRGLFLLSGGVWPIFRPLRPTEGQSTATENIDPTRLVPENTEKNHEGHEAHEGFDRDSSAWFFVSFVFFVVLLKANHLFDILQAGVMSPGGAVPKTRSAGGPDTFPQ